MKYSWLLIVFLLLNCNSKNISHQTDTRQQGNVEKERLADPLILDGKPYKDKTKTYRKNEARLITHIYCNFSLNNDEGLHSFEGFEQLENLETLSIVGEIDKIDFTPLASLLNLRGIDISGSVVDLRNIKGLEQLVSLEELTINWESENFADMDFTPLASLPKLETLRFAEPITHLPDLTRLTNLRNISICNYSSSPYAMLDNLEGIGAPNLKTIKIKNEKEINSFVPLNNLVYLEYLELSLYNNSDKKIYKITDMADLPNLKYLRIGTWAKIDLRGIEKMSSLEELLLKNCEPFNIENIGKLSNLKKLSINLISNEPSLEFLRNMPNIMELNLDANNHREDFPHYSKAYQILDVSPLATLKKLRTLRCVNFIIKNISALDVLDAFGDFDDNNVEIEEFHDTIFLWKCILYDKTEKSKHRLFFEIEGDH